MLMYRLGDVCIGVSMTVPRQLAFIFDPLLLFWFLFLKYFILYKYVTLYCVFLYQAHYGWMYHIFMLKSQVAKYFSKIF